MYEETSELAQAQLPRVTIVTPFYNEQDLVTAYFERLTTALAGLAREFEFEFVCVNDGSRDETLAALRACRPAFGKVVIVDLSRNFGKEAALSAGLDFATGDAIVPIDADLQDPPELIPEMISKWQEGAPVVLAVRVDRSSDGWLKRTTAAAFYRIHSLLASTQIPANVGDFRLMDRAVVEVVRKLPEQQRFMKGLFAWAGFPSETIGYIRRPRAIGRSKWNYGKLFTLATEGITSFSVAPLRVSMLFGLAFSVAAMVYGGYIALRAMIDGVVVPGYASLSVALVFMGGIQLLSLGILGEYIGKIYMESKHRPIYVVREIVETHAQSQCEEAADTNSKSLPSKT